VHIKIDEQKTHPDNRVCDVVTTLGIVGAHNFIALSQGFFRLVTPHALRLAFATIHSLPPGIPKIYVSGISAIAVPSTAFIATTEFAVLMVLGTLGAGRSYESLSRSDVFAGPDAIAPRVSKIAALPTLFEP